MLLKISQNSQENTCVGVSFLIKLQAWGDCFWTNNKKLLYMKSGSFGSGLFDFHKFTTTILWKLYPKVIPKLFFMRNVNRLSRTNLIKSWILWQKIGKLRFFNISKIFSQGYDKPYYYSHKKWKCVTNYLFSTSKCTYIWVTNYVLYVVMEQFFGKS